MDIKQNKNNTDYTKKRLLQLFWAVEVASSLIFFRSLYQGNTSQAIGLAIVIFICFIVYWFAKQGKTALAGNLLLLITSIMMLTFMWMYDGIRDEVLLIFPAIILFSIHIGSRLFAFFIYLIVSINIILIGYLNELGYMHNGQSGSTINSAVIIIIIISVIGYAVWLISKDLLSANKALLTSKNELEQRVKERTAELQNSLLQLTQAQDQLIEAEKMASLGRLVAGVAHEINTPLGISITAASHLEIETAEFNIKFKDNDVSKKNLAKQITTTQVSSDLILNNLTRAANLVQNFKEVAVDQSNEQRRKFNLKNYLREILSSLQPKVKNTAYEVELNCNSDLIIYSAPGAIAQIITNLFINAIHHGFEHQEAGKIILSVGLSKNTEKEQIELIFSDNGCGMSPTNLTKIFEPFFTTKRGSGGSGLGMHIVYNLVSQSLQGKITCTSTIDEGTQFIITFPCKVK